MRLPRLGMTPVALLAVAVSAPADYSWQQPHARVLPHGDLQWAPAPYRFEAGSSVRYIDFENGDDTRDGASPATAWKHHPLDQAAGGAARAARDARGAHTYIFKGGVVYRGRLQGRLEGAPDNPVRLTCDPRWGRGPAILSGAAPVAKWTRGAGRSDIPKANLVWRAELDFSPRAVWIIAPDGTAQRLTLAREPNWRVSDPDDVMSEWWQWEQPEWWTDRNQIEVGGQRMHLGIDRRRLTGRAEDYVGGIVWSEWGIVMGTPFASRIEAFDAQQRGIAFQGVWYGASGKIITGNRYFLEDRPNFLDAPGEFWFDRREHGGGTLYLRLPGDRDPNTVRIEAARHPVLVDLVAARHVRIENLMFRCTNVFWDLTARGFVDRDVEAAAVRLLGSGDDVRIAHCRFEHVNKAVRLKAIEDSDTLDRIVVADNDIRFTDHGAIEIEDSSRWAKTDPPFGELRDVRVLRNRLFEIGHRPFRSDSAHALVVRFPETLEVAGNILDRCYGAGIFVFGGKGSDETRDRPLCRLLIHHNKVTNSLLAANDWGGIETWQGGPAYVFNNISGNANGYWNWAYRPENPASARLGFAYYLDGAFKNYHFNNIAWGVSNDLASRRCSHTAFYQAVPTILNLFAHNTAWNFADGSHWSPAGGRQIHVANLWLSISRRVFDHARQKEDQDAKYDELPIETLAYARNVFHDVAPQIARLEGLDDDPKELAAFRAALAQRGALAAEVGVIASQPPAPFAARGDFRPAPGGAAAGRGARFFVPWALARTVGEWNFHRNNRDPAVAFDEHWYMSPRVVDRMQYFRLPRYDLRGTNIRADNYVAGPLEDWTLGAVRFNGQDQYFALAADAPSVRRAFPGPHDADRRFIVEAYFRAAPRAGAGAIVSDLADRGYELATDGEGRLVFLVRTPQGEARATTPDAVNDGAWHHALAECDLAAGAIRLYVDGRAAAEAPARFSSGARNSADLFVARGAAGFFAGEVDFVRLALSTLAESKTTIGELYAWQFDGPFLRDFTGAKRPEGRRTAGALEAAMRPAP